MRLKNYLRSVFLALAFLATAGGIFAQADLSLSLTQQPTTPQQYSVYSVTATITNDGPEDATNVAVSIPLVTGVVYQGGSEFTATAGSFSPYGNQMWAIPVVVAGTSETLTINYFLRVDPAPGSYGQVMASDQSDPDSTPGNGTPPTVGEDDEASTLINGGFVPDLTLTNLALIQNPVDSGQQFDFTFDINNIGSGSIGQNFLIQAYISTDATISPDDLQNGTVPTGNFDPGQSETGVLGASIPVGLSPGSYFLILAADANGQVLESNESNNTISIPLTIETPMIQTCEVIVESVSILCDDNGTPQDPSDDLAIIDVLADNVSGNSFTVESAAGVILGNGTYGTTLSFSVDLFNNQNRILDYVIRDSAEPSTCSASFSVTGPSICSPNGPDLQVSNLQLDTNVVAANGDIAFTFDLTNAGATAISQTFLVQAFLSVDEVLSSDDIQNGTVPTGGFGPSQTVSGVIGASNVSALSPGNYFLILFADANRQVAEVLENNNLSSAVPFTVVNQTSATDLEVSIVQNEAQPAQYSLYSVTATLSNTGTQMATGVVLDLPLPAGVVYEGGNEFVASQGQFSTFGSNQGEWTVGSIPTGQSAELTINYFLRVPTAPSSYVEVLAANEQDIDSTPGNGNGQVNEDDEASTLINGGFVPDLTLSNLTLAQNAVDSGAQIDFTVDINNLGLGSIAQNFLVQAYISTDNVLSSDDLQNGTIPTGTFAGGQTVAGVMGASIPVGLSPGSYFLILEADANDQVLESNENNNLISAPFTIEAVIAPTCDIAVTVQSIDCDDQGTPDGSDDTYSVTFLVENGGVQGTWTGSNGGLNPNFNGSFGVPFTLQGGNIVSANSTGGIQLSVDFTADANLGCTTTGMWTPPSSTCSSEPTDPCDAIPAYLASLNDPEKVTVSETPGGVITVTYLTPAGGVDSFSFDGPAELGITPIDDNTFLAAEVACTSTGFAVIGTFRDDINPGSAQPFLFMLDSAGGIVQATIPPFASSYTDILDFNIVDIATSGAGGDILYVEVFSFSRSYQLAAFDANANLLWQDQRIGDLVTNRIGGSVLSPDESTIYFSYRDGNSQFWTRFRGVDALTGATLWEQQLALLVLSNPTSLISGNVSKPLAMQNGDGALTFSTNDGGLVSFHLTQFDPLGNVIYTTPLQTTNLNVPVFAGANDVVVVSDGTELLVYENGDLVNCGGSQGIDLELSAVSAQAQPAIYDVNSITFTLTNTGSDMASSISVDVPRPAEVVYTSGNEFTASQGTFSPYGNNSWSVGDLAPGATATLVVNYFSRSAAANGYTQYAEVAQMDGTDVDSTPGNGNGTSAIEDDEVFLDLTFLSNTQALTFFPNPLPQGEQVILDFVSSGETTQTVIFSDLTGRPVQTIQVAFQEGRNQIPVDLGTLPAGVYVVAFPASGLLPKRIIVQE